MLEAMLVALGTALLKELGPVLVKVVERIANGEDPLTALDAERVGEILPHPSKLAIARALERAQRGLPPEDGAPSAPSDR